MKTALTIAGSDCSGGAGIQADIKTMTMCGVYAMSAITALTAQNTQGVTSVTEVSPDFLRQQIDAVFEDIRPDAVKIGMVPSAALVEVIAERLKHYGAEHIIVDPVAVSTSGSRLSTTNGYEAMKKLLLPIAELVTPNIPEAELISGLTINSEEEMITAAKSIGKRFGCSVLCKGGHNTNSANDFLFTVNGEGIWFRGKRIDTTNTHGTGCTLSSAIAANLAKEHSMRYSIQTSKEYVSSALSAGLDLGKGSGPVHHSFDLKSRFAE